MNFKTARILSILLFAASMVAAMSLYMVPQAYALAAVGLFILLAAAAFAILMVFYRCPYCKERFPVGKNIRSTKCPHCGKELDTTI